MFQNNYHPTGTNFNSLQTVWVQILDLSLPSSVTLTLWLITLCLTVNFYEKVVKTVPFQKKKKTSYACEN